ncbi:hypothetical protein BGZ96_004384 [Linnemannia gamsii]|uniref:Uncharacterized protein n=1 Tax=Linnemannia gamsii TaxID=64522 RepID=A0ABQ7K705_9FUNG|nr:hypothetical protein BGZ96_004384 [Linnemannia gamsii]
MEKRGDIKAPKLTCQPSTLKWKLRNLDTSKPQESFELYVRNTYMGRTSFGSRKMRATVKSGDNKFSVNHGAPAKGQLLALTWRGKQYDFYAYSFSRFNMGEGNKLSTVEYEYWACLGV